MSITVDTDQIGEIICNSYHPIIDKMIKLKYVLILEHFYTLP